MTNLISMYYNGYWIMVSLIGENEDGEVIARIEYNCYNMARRYFSKSDKSYYPKIGEGLLLSKSFVIDALEKIKNSCKTI